MAHKTYLLAYPRSGSSIFRLLMARLTRMRPAQASGGVEAPMMKILGDIEFKGEFFKYHTKKDGPFNMPLDYQDTLIHLVRDPLENLVSWVFSLIYKKNRTAADINKAEHANKFIMEWNSLLARQVRHHKANARVFELHDGAKLLISYEKMLASPAYLVTELQKHFTIANEDIQRYIHEFDALKQSMMNQKSGPNDSIRLNTFGDPTFWHKTLSEEAIAKFDERYKNSE